MHQNQTNQINKASQALSKYNILRFAQWILWVQQHKKQKTFFEVKTKQSEQLIFQYFMINDHRTLLINTIYNIASHIKLQYKYAQHFIKRDALIQKRSYL
ncbi:hypothetical protein ABPG72_005666 [Tetrahymena utriculariae]